MGETITKIISPGSVRRQEKERKRAAQLQAQQAADIRRQTAEEEKKRKARRKALEARSGGFGVTLFMNELGVERAKSTQLGGT